MHFPTRSPLVSPGLFHFRAALDLLDQDWGGDPGHAKGSWDALVRRVRRASGTVIVSHEILAPARPEHVARAMADLADSEVHVVYSARDLGRAIPAAWQESIKQGRKWPFRKFLRRCQNAKPWFVRAFDLPAVLGTWGSDLTPDRMHVVTVPPSGGDTTGGGPLWLRFCEAFGIDPAWAPEDSERTNRSLGVAETQLIRQLNRRLDRQTRREAAYDALIRDMLAENELVNTTSAPVRLPPEAYGWVEQNSQRSIDYLRQSGVNVIGDLEDLRPVWPSDDDPVAEPRPGVAPQAAQGRGRRAGRDDRGGGVADRPRPAARTPDPRPRREAAEPVNADTAADQGERRAWGWVHHLRDGGTTPWAAWARAG